MYNILNHVYKNMIQCKMFGVARHLHRCVLLEAQPAEAQSAVVMKTTQGLGQRSPGAPPEEVKPGQTIKKREEKNSI
jgi:hypothetical protein